MNDEQHNTPQSVERISLTDLYQELPEHLDSAEPYDVEAGLARFNTWIDSQDEAPDRAIEPTEHANVTFTLHETGTGKSIEFGHALTPELAARWLHLEEQRFELERKRGKAEVAALNHRLDQEALEAEHRRQLEVAEAEHRRTVELRKIHDPEAERRELQEFRIAARRIRARVIAFTVPTLTWLAAFVLSILREWSNGSILLGAGLFALGSAYGSAVLLATRTATTAPDPLKREHAARILRFLMFREEPAHEAREKPADASRPRRKVYRRL
ncbi:hypothetical protein [Actinoplanes sp. G11-F43]|uniref:hypothetical protein n=1 Tax=Actinoplanes sp. G11-F43 TaxID=3424130 RepID=UPI003D32ED9F